MKRYLSFGGGVDSTALMLWLLDQGEELFEIIFVDHKADYPETYQYIEYLKKKGYPITVIDGGSLIDYCEINKVFPMKQWKWCTDKFKLRPLKRYLQVPCICFIGIGAYEKRRLKQFGALKEGVFNVMPLISLQMSRKETEEFIVRHGLKAPPKSGCYICPNANLKEIQRLQKIHPDLYIKRMKLQKQAEINFNQKKNRTIPQFIHKIMG